MLENEIEWRSTEFFLRQEWRNYADIIVLYNLEPYICNHLNKCRNNTEGHLGFRKGKQNINWNWMLLLFYNENFFKDILHCQQFSPGQIDLEKTRISALSTNPDGLSITAFVTITAVPILAPFEIDTSFASRATTASCHSHLKLFDHPWSPLPEPLFGKSLPLIPQSQQQPLNVV